MDNTNQYQYDFGQKYKIKGIGKYLIASFYQKIKDLIGRRNYTYTLEVGCGEGYSTKQLKNILTTKVFEASEYREDLVKTARKKNPSVKIIQEDIYKLNHRSRLPDLIICLEVLEHLEHPANALKELAQNTKKHLLLSVPNEPIWRFLNMLRFKYISDWGNTPGHLNHWNIRTIRQIVSPYFKIIEIKKPLPWLILLLEKK